MEFITFEMAPLPCTTDLKDSQNVVQFFTSALNLGNMFL